MFGYVGRKDYSLNGLLAVSYTHLIEVGENFNLPKSENARVPQCPKEKEDAIKAALKYFAMI